MRNKRKYRKGDRKRLSRALSEIFGLALSVEEIRIVRELVAKDGALHVTERDKIMLTVRQA